MCKKVSEVSNKVNDLDIRGKQRSAYSWKEKRFRQLLTHSLFSFSSSIKLTNPQRLRKKKKIGPIQLIIRYEHQGLLMFQIYLEHITLNNYPVLPSPSYSQILYFESHPPRVVCTRRPTPESALLPVLRIKPQSSSKQQVEEGQAICIPQSCFSRDTAECAKCRGRH